MEGFCRKIDFVLFSADMQTVLIIGMSVEDLAVVDQQIQFVSRYDLFNRLFKDPEPFFGVQGASCFLLSLVDPVDEMAKNPFTVRLALLLVDIFIQGGTFEHCTGMHQGP